MHSWKVWLGIVVFILLATTPFWLNLQSQEKATRAPELEYPTKADKCIENTEYMKAYHMDMLNEWRDKVVRQDQRYTIINGEKTEMSLSKTCMDCHESKANFCDRCHSYMEVDPYCWDCHVDPASEKSYKLNEELMFQLHHEGIDTTEAEEEEMPENNGEVE